MLCEGRPDGFENELVERLSAAHVVDRITGGQEALAWLAESGVRSGSERARWSRECARMRREVMAGAAA